VTNRPRQKVRSTRKLMRRSFAVRAGIGFLVAALVLAAVGSLASSGILNRLDNAARAAANGVGTPAATTFFRAMTKLGSTLVLTIVGAAAILLFAVFRQWRAVWLFCLGMAGQIILHHGFKWIFGRNRPESLFGYVVDDSPSFPSGHALASMAVYGLLALLITNRLDSTVSRAVIWVTAAALILLIGTSRLYFGVHHASDVFAGYVSAGIWVAVVASGDDRKRN